MGTPPFRICGADGTALANSHALRQEQGLTLRLVPRKHLPRMLRLLHVHKLTWHWALVASLLHHHGRGSWATKSMLTRILLVEVGIHMSLCWRWHAMHLW